MSEPHEQGEWSWGELRRRALLGASSAQGAQDPVDELLAQLSACFLLTQGARVTLEPERLRGDVSVSHPPAPPQLGVHPERRERLQALLYQAGAPSSSKHAHLPLALSFYLCTLAHLNRTLPLTLIAPVLSRVLSPLQAQGSAAQARAQLAQLPLSLDALLSAVGPRGRWLITRDPVWGAAMSGLEGPLVERTVSVTRLSVEALERGLEALTRGEVPQDHGADLSPQVALQRLLIMSHPSALRASLKGPLVRGLFKQLKLDYAPWASLLQSDLLEQLDAECRA